MSLTIKLAFWSDGSHLVIAFGLLVTVKKSALIYLSSDETMTSDQVCQTCEIVNGFFFIFLLKFPKTYTDLTFKF